jgi:hypothetical protein
MPRISAEARAAAVFRSGVAGQEPPEHLTVAAKRLWREIVDDRPADFFRPGSLQLLEVFCQLTIEERRCCDECAWLRARKKPSCCN